MCIVHHYAPVTQQVAVSEGDANTLVGYKSQEFL